MKRSIRARPGPTAAGTAVLAAIDLSSRLVVPAGALALLAGQREAAVVAAVLVSALAVARGVAGGWLVERVVRSLWPKLVAAARRYQVADPRRLSEEGGVMQLINATYNLAHIRAAAVPRLIADAVGVAAVCTVVPCLLGLRWLLVGLAVLLIGGVLVRFGQRHLRAAEHRAVELLGEVGADLQALLLGAAELRGQAREAALAQVLVARVRSMALEQRRVATYSALIGLLPFAVALLVATLPLGSFFRDWVGVGTHRHLAEIGVLGGAALVFGVGLLRGIEAVVRAEPHRARLTSFLRDAGPPQDAAPVGPAGAVSVAAEAGSWRAPIELVSLEVTYPGSQAATPHALDGRWPVGKALAVLGDNGSGKTTLALVLLGLVQPTAGRVTLGGTPLAERDIDALRRRVIYLPQNAFVDPVRSVGWHLRLVLGGDVSEQELRRALCAVGLDNTLRRPGLGGGPLDVPLGALSGGERRRVQLARLFVEQHAQEPELYVVDEPEAGLDAAGRVLLTARLAELAERARVLLIAHDRRVVPAGFGTVTCRRGPAPRGRSGRVVRGARQQLRSSR